MKPIIIALPLCFIVTGCVYRVKEIDPNKNVQYTEEYGHTDQKKAVEHFSQSLAKSNSLAVGDTKPVIVLYPISNRTLDHIDTKGFSDKLEASLLQGGRVRLINQNRSEVNAETSPELTAKVDPAMRVQEAKRLGADYILSGRFTSIDRKEPKGIRLRKGRLLYYQLTLELTRLETNELVWKDNVEMLREGRKPIIGW
ncbi:MAG: hypothetical protein O3B01_26685 [Planctomycetota bacterium]|nr:hypothetical protein [Planctomycetota bacterium]MDA1142164.1 hypothetical protein [Planctomycetota bacterium]